MIHFMQILKKAQVYTNQLENILDDPKVEEALQQKRQKVQEMEAGLLAANRK